MIPQPKLHPDVGPHRHAHETRYHNTAFLTQATSLKIALIVLNVDRHQDSSAVRFERLWEHASLRVCADGAANRLFDSLNEGSRDKMLPDVISGDLDSIRGDVADYYERVGVQLAKKSEQDTNDFEKCLQWIEHKEAERVGELSIVAAGVRSLLLLCKAAACTCCP